MNEKPTRTSYSALTTFEECPLQYKLYYLDGIKDDSPKPAADRGTRLHTLCEKFLKDEIPIGKLTTDFRLIKTVLVLAKEYGAKAEEVWLCTNDGKYQEVEDENTRFKAVVDIHYIIGDILYIKDLKTGRAYPEHADQLQAYATLGFMKYPHVELVHVSALYLEGDVHQATYTREHAEHLLLYWALRWNALFESTQYLPNPSPDNCRWCPYRASKGGPCEYA